MEEKEERGSAGGRDDGECDYIYPSRTKTKNVLSSGAVGNYEKEK